MLGDYHLPPPEVIKGMVQSTWKVCTKLSVFEKPLVVWFTFIILVINEWLQRLEERVLGLAWREQVNMQPPSAPSNSSKKQFLPLCQPAPEDSTTVGLLSVLSCPAVCAL